MEDRLVKIKREVRKFVGRLLAEAKWDYAVYHQNQLVWCNDERRVWCKVCDGYDFDVRRQWYEEKLTYLVLMKSKQNCIIDKVAIRIEKNNEELYSREEILNSPLKLRKGDSFELTLQFDI